MEKFHFRRAKFEDLPNIVALLAEDPLGAQREDISMPLNPRYLAAFAAIDRDANQHLTVIELDGALIGCLQLSFIPGLSRLGAWRGQVESVRIARAYRGQQIGTALFEWVVDICRARGCTLIQLTTDKSRHEAKKFYESLGFVASHEGMKLILNGQ